MNIPDKRKYTRLGEWASTAICGNDILSTSLYVSGIVIIFAGVYAPLVFLAVVLVLVFFKAIYTEVVGALPINGGAYNCLLNSTSKPVAAFAGVAIFLTYMTTAVISSKTAVEYVNTLIPLPVAFVTICLLAVFAVIVIWGIQGSSKVASGIFLFHLLTMFFFLVFGLLFFLSGNSNFAANIEHTNFIIGNQGGFIWALFYAFSAGLLGVSGFESSADFIEDQKHGVFPKTLRNMLISVALLTPLITLVVLNTMDYSNIYISQNFLLADVAEILAGPYFKYIVVADAFLVLSGAILTAYIGVSGLLSRMAADSCLPHYLTIKNRRGSYPLIVMTFLFLSSSIFLLAGKNLLSLAGVYTVSFLTVMTLFAFGNLLLKMTRKDLKRTYHAPKSFVLLGIAATTLGILGNLKLNPENVKFFAMYFFPLFTVVLAIIYKNNLLKLMLRIFKNFPWIRKFLSAYSEEMREGKFIAFIHNPEHIFKILDYIHRNETGRSVIFVECRCEGHVETGASTEKINEIIMHLQEAGAFVNFTISAVFSELPFGPEAIEHMSRKHGVKKNKVLIGSIHTFHPFDYVSLGGVRVIF